MNSSISTRPILPHGTRIVLEIDTELDSSPELERITRRIAHLATTVVRDFEKGERIARDMNISNEVKTP
jgi:hypothetical protein